MKLGEFLEISPTYLENEAGERTGVVLSMEDWAAIQRLIDPSGGGEDVLESLKAQGLGLDDLKVCR